MTYDHKRIADPVHGTIGLSELEVNVIGTSVFQRLRNIKQLGLAHYVFPGADYSRFSHSLGVCHVTGRILESLGSQYPDLLDHDNIQLYRLAALLHDVGHYPFSHAMEDAIANESTGQLLEPDIPEESGEFAGEPQGHYSHEEMGEQVLLNDPEIRKVLASANIDPASVVAIFRRKKPTPLLSNLVSSEIDADRIDFLLRTAHYSGLPYGNIDLDYLLSQLRLDDQSRICLTEKALKTADHFLLCRYFDYQQVAFHKTVAGLECVLKDVLSILVRRGIVKGSADSMRRLLESKLWSEFDDASVIQKMRQLTSITEGDLTETEADKIRAILERPPPKLVADMELINKRDDASSHLNNVQLITDRIERWSKEFNIDPSCWYIWQKAGIPLTKVGSRIQMSVHYESQSDERDKYDQEIRILRPSSQSSRAITEVPHSLMHALADDALYMLRLYVLLPVGSVNLVDTISKKIRTDLPNIKWK